MLFAVFSQDRQRHTLSFHRVHEDGVEAQHGITCDDAITIVLHNENGLASLRGDASQPEPIQT
jgi:hypothetical protein